MKRRTVLAGAAALPMLGLAGPALRNLFSESKQLIYDEKLSRAQLAAQRARAMGLGTQATGGEIATLLLGRGRADVSADAGSVIGLTGYSEFVLAGDILRRQGRAVRPIAQFDTSDNWLEQPQPGSEAHRLVAALLASEDAVPQSRATGFVWLA